MPIPRELHSTNKTPNINSRTSQSCLILPVINGCKCKCCYMSTGWKERICEKESQRTPSQGLQAEWSQGLLVMHPIQILAAFNYSQLLCTFHLCTCLIQKEWLWISMFSMLGGTGNSHFYCSWPDMLHLLGNPPFLFLPSHLSPTPTRLNPYPLPYSGRCFSAPAPLHFNLFRI